MGNSLRTVTSISLVGVLLAAVACTVRGPRVERVSHTSDADGGEGIYYWLPRTVVTVSMDLVRTDEELTDLGVAALIGESAKPGKPPADAPPATTVQPPTIAEQGTTGGGQADGTAQPPSSVLKQPPEAEGQPNDPVAASDCPAEVDIEKPGPTCQFTEQQKARLAWVKEWIGVDLAPMVAFKPTRCKKNGDDADNPIALCCKRLTSVTSFKIAAVRIGFRAEPDPDHGYRIDLRGHSLEDRKVDVQMSALGLLSTAKAATDDKTLATIAKVIKTGGSIATSVITGTLVPGAYYLAPSTDSVSPTSIKGMAVEGTGIPERVARLALTYQSLRMRYMEWLTKVAGDYKSGDMTRIAPEVYAKVLSELKSEMAAIQAAFWKSTETKWTLELEYVPATAETSCGSPMRAAELMEIPLALFNSGNGLRALGLSTLRPIHPKFLGDVPTAAPQEPKGACSETVPCALPKWTEIRLAIERTPASAQFSALVRRAMAASNSEASFRYRIPAQIRATVLDGSPAAASGLGGKRLPRASALLPVAQLGAVGTIPARLAGSGADYDIQFYEDLGALRGAKIAAKADDAGAVIDAVGESATSIIAADAELRKAKREAGKPPSELAPLLDERDRLKLELEIEQLKASLDEVRKKNPQPAGGDGTGD